MSRVFNQDHTTIIHSVKTIEKIKEKDPEMVENINKLKNFKNTKILYGFDVNKIKMPLLGSSRVFNSAFAANEAVSSLLSGIDIFLSPKP